MLAGMLEALIAIGYQFEVNPPRDPSIWFDLANVQWWQAVIVILVGLGLSPAPWILGLAQGKIQFTAVSRKDFERQLAERDRFHDALMVQERQRYADSEAARKLNADAAERERARAEKATDVLVEMTEVVQGAQHFMRSQLEASGAQVVDHG